MALEPRQWPEATYLDGMHVEVKFPAGEQVPCIGVPEAWRLIFLQHKRQGKFPYMYDKLVTRKEDSAVGRAFRRFMNHVLDGKVYEAHK